MRPDGRNNDEIRTVKIQRKFMETAEGSVLISMGNTRVICTASIEEKVPPFLKDQKKGWVTAEYSMLPRSTQTRTFRESSSGRVSGRTHEIQRLIGRALRSVVDLSCLGERTIWVDCDVIQADGGTRTAAITGAFIALSDAIQYALKKGLIERTPLQEYIAAISVGVVNGNNIIDLCYSEDSIAEVDMNIVMTQHGRFVELQGTAEGKPFSRESLEHLLQLAEEGIYQLIHIQKQVIEGDVLTY